MKPSVRWKDGEASLKRQSVNDAVDALGRHAALSPSCRSPTQLVEVCVVDGDAPPERFDHVFTLPREQVPRDTRLDFLRKDGLTPAETEVKSQSPSVIALTGFRVR